MPDWSRQATNTKSFRVLYPCIHPVNKYGFAFSHLVNLLLLTFLV